MTTKTEVRICAWCREVFEPRTPRMIFCSKGCSNRASYHRGSNTCTAEGCSRKHLAKGLCTIHYRKANGGSHGSPETRVTKLREKSARRRAVMVAPDADRDITRDEVGRRGGWVCAWCSSPIDKNLAYPDRLSASVDHVLALGDGGRHTWENVQIVHLGCNNEKGAASRSPRSELIAHL